MTLAVATIALFSTGCFHADYASPTATFHGVTYTLGVYAVIPEADLTAVGQPDAFDDPGGYSHASDQTLYEIRGVGRSEVLAMAIDPRRWESEDAEPIPTHELFLANGLENLPEAVCGYYDPKLESTPLECQAPLRVTLSGTTYRPVPDDPSNKVLQWVYGFAPGDLVAIGQSADLDPRLGGNVDPTAFAITGIDPAEIIVLTVDNSASGDETGYLVFQNETAAALPPELCQYSVDEVTGCP
jgi:hypothetical protein